MKSKLSRVFGAAAIAGASFLTAPASAFDAVPQIAQQTPAANPLNAVQQRKLQEMASTFYTIMDYASVSSVIKPDMRKYGSEALKTLADKSATDELVLTADDAKAIKDALGLAKPLALGPVRFDDPAIEALAYVYVEMAARAMIDGMPPVKLDEVTSEMFNKMLAELDSHSGYSTPAEAREMMQKMSGQFGGLGIEVTEDDNKNVTVQGVMDKGPAKRGDFKSGDKIVEVDGKAVTGLGLDEVVKRMRGDVNTAVSITLERNGQRLAPQTLTREIIEQSTVRANAIGTDIGYARITSFGQKTTQDLEAEITKLKKDMPQMKSFILDLRSNPGGLLDHAEGVSDLFLEKGNITSVGDGGKRDRRTVARPGDILNGMPMVVLIDGYSASASEIVSGALQGNNRAVILGTQSFGKGSVQSVITLGNGGILRLTTALYFTATGASIQGRGITPNVGFDSEEIRQMKADPNYKPMTEADMAHTLPNPNLVKDTTKTAAICEPAPGAGPAQVKAPDEKVLKITLRDKSQIVDFQTACAVETLRAAHPRTLTVTNPVAVPGVKPAPAP